MSAFGDRLKQLRISRGLSQQSIADAIDVNKQTISQYERGVRRPNPDLAEALADFFNVDLDYLYGRSDVVTRICKYDSCFLPISVNRIPLLGSVACGKPVYADEEFQYYVAVGAEIRADFALHAKGDSMIGARINDGDIVFVRQTNAVDNGEIAVVIIGDEATLKRVYYYPEKSILILKAENPKYDDMVYSDSELEQIRILGKAVAVQADVR